MCTGPSPVRSDNHRCHPQWPVGMKVYHIGPSSSGALGPTSSSRIQAFALETSNPKLETDTVILVATSNPGKLRDFAAVAVEFGIELAPVPRLAFLPPPLEDAATFDGNARKKAEHYSEYSPRELVLADDSGLEVDALHGNPGVHSARFAAFETGRAGNSTDAENKARLLRDMSAVPDAQRAARFVCVIAAAREGETIATFRGEASGVILHTERGTGGFGYDPLFYVPDLGKTFAELTPEEKALVSHRGRAFRKFLDAFTKGFQQRR